MYARIALVALLALGTWRSLSLSAERYQTDAGCPSLATVPACYVALTGYLLMVAGVTGNHFGIGQARWLFWLGLAIAGGLALLGSGLELANGNVCPRAWSWLPMCYASLALSAVIGWLYVRQQPTRPSAGLRCPRGADCR